MAKREERLGLLLTVYLAGLLIGGLYVGMVSPARTVIQAGFGIDGATGIWMINIYTLFYAALIPVIGKIADRRGRKRVYTTCIGLFCLGCVMCGVSQWAGGFGLLLAGRVVQAAGAGGMIPVANAAIGTSFPPEKRGMALGLAAAVMGVANVFGAAAGSAIVGFFGTSRWSAMFFVCIPFCALLASSSLAFLPSDVPDQNEEHAKQPMDVKGSILFVVFVLLLLLSVKGIDPAALGQSIASPSTWLPLIGALAVLPLFRFVEQRAESPVFHLEYFHSRPIVITMVVSFFIGCFVISLVLVPELAEFAMGDPLGSGGYYVMAIGLTSFVATPIGGKSIDRFGPKPVIMGGLAISICGLLFLAFAVMAQPNMAGLVAGLAIVGAGMGLAMGAPTNYMILENTSKEESTSAIATITLIRQIGTSIAPALFIALVGATPSMVGYRNMLLCVALFNACAFVVMLFYRSPNGK